MDKDVLLQKVLIFWFGRNTTDSNSYLFILTFNLEIWMGENLRIPFTEGTSLLNKACEAEHTNNTVSVRVSSVSTQAL